MEGEMAVSSGSIEKAGCVITRVIARGFATRAALTYAAMLVALIGAVLVLALGPVGTATADEPPPLSGPPVLTISSPTSGSLTKAPSPPVSGTTSDLVDQVTLTIYAGSSAEGSPVQSETTSPSLSGEWEVSTTPLPDGLYTALATQTNGLTSESGSSAPVTFTIDSTPPAVSIDPVYSPTNDPTPTLQGAAGTEAGDEPSVTVTVYSGESTGGSMVAAENVAPSGGAWSYAVSPGLADGTYTAQATQRDTAGNVGESSAVRFTVDTTAPSISISRPESGRVLDSSKPTFEGHAGTAGGDSSSVGLLIYAGSSASGSPLQSLSIEREGSHWSTGYSSPELADGVYTAVATQRDAAGNTGYSTGVTFTIDTTRPVVAISAPYNGELLDSSDPTFEGSAGTAAGDGATVKLRIYSGRYTSGSVVQTLELTRYGGVWRTGSPGPRLDDGTYTAQATQSDEAGNTGSSLPVTFRIDTTPPEVRATLPHPGDYLSTSRPTFEGYAGDAEGDSNSVRVAIYTGTSISGNYTQALTVTREGDHWTTGSKGPQLPDGTYTFEATQSDSAGNTGTSVPRSFTIKTDSPVVQLNPPAPMIDNATPSFSGSADTAAGDSSSVTLMVYRGESASPANLVETLDAPREAGGAWTSGPTHRPLPDGVYTAQADQQDEAGHTGVSAGSIFTVDTTPPVVTLTEPKNGITTASESLRVAGEAGVAKGDLSAVTVQLFAGSTASGAPQESLVVNSSKGLWSGTLGGLSTGVYTVRAVQADQAGNLGTTVSSTFTVALPGPLVTLPPAPPGDSPPAASFTSFPVVPKVGESVSLASSSTDATSPIVAYAWDLLGNGPFQANGPVLVTSFATPGSHLVRLRVTDAAGLSSIVAETISVVSRPIPLMQPFPIVRIVGSDTRAGARLTLLTVLAPVGASVSVRCRGGGCPTKLESQTAAAPKHRSASGTVLVSFRRFERSLKAGASLEIRVTKPDQIGKYTRFQIRRNRPPLRVDACVEPVHGNPIACPSS